MSNLIDDAIEEEAAAARVSPIPNGPPPCFKLRIVGTMPEHADPEGNLWRTYLFQLIMLDDAVSRNAAPGEGDVLLMEQEAVGGPRPILIPSLPIMVRAAPAKKSLLVPPRLVGPGGQPIH